MATLYLRSTDGSDVDNGTTWALAKATIAGIGAIDSAGDTIYISQNHAESTAGAVTYSGAGTNASPIKLICGNDAAEPPTAVASTATISTTGANSITLNGTHYWYGATFQAGDSTNAASILSHTGSGSQRQVYENCSFYLRGSGSSGKISIVGASGAETLWKNCTVKFANASHGIQSNSTGFFKWDGGSILSGGTSPTTLMLTNVAYRFEISGVDLSNGSSTMNLVNPSNSTVVGVFRDCKLPASWTGNLFSTAPVYMSTRVEMYNCDSGDTNYRLWVEDIAGSIKHETTIVRTGGASDGTTSLAWKMATSASAIYPTIRLVSPEIVQWNDTTGSSKTVTLEIVHDSQGAGTGSAFQDNEIWIEVMYLGTSGFPLGSWISDAKADVLATAADQTSSSETWTTTGLTTPVKQKLSVTFTPQEKGYIHARVVMCKASKTCYIDPKLTVA